MSKPADEFIRAFYSPEPLRENVALSVMDKARESARVKLRFFEENLNAIIAAARGMATAFRDGHKMLVCGNGGSSTDAQHIAVEFMHPVMVGRVALPVFCLSNDIATVTAVANDVSFADVFSRQVEALGRKGDILLGISTSGNSDNLLRAFETARRMKMLTIAYAGGDGGRMSDMARAEALDFCLTVPTSSIHRVQETHVVLYHVTWDLVHTFLQAEGGSAAL
jgi:D-sedoheptulose 7-phosphate isomerase